MLALSSVVTGLLPAWLALMIGFPRVWAALVDKEYDYLVKKGLLPVGLSDRIRRIDSLEGDARPWPPHLLDISGHVALPTSFHQGFEVAEHSSHSLYFIRLLEPGVRAGAIRPGLLDLEPAWYRRRWPVHTFFTQAHRDT